MRTIPFSGDHIVNEKSTKTPCFSSSVETYGMIFTANQIGDRLHRSDESSPDESRGAFLR